MEFASQYARSGKPYRCILWGGYAWGNVGDELTLAVALHDMRRRYGNSIAILTRSTGYTHRLFPDFDLIPYDPISRPQGLGEPLSYYDVEAQLASADWAKHLARAEALYLVGGGYLSDLFHLDWLLLPAIVARRCGVKIATAPVGLGPFQSEVWARRVVEVFQDADINVRDGASLDFCRQYGIPATFRDDDGFRLAEVLSLTKRAKRADGDVRRIGVNVFGQYGTSRHEESKRWWAALLECLTNEQATLEGFCFHNLIFEDLAVTSECFARAGHNPECVASPSLDFRAECARLSQFDAIVSSRFHAIVVANSLGIPTFAVCDGEYYSRKMEAATKPFVRSTLVRQFESNPQEVARSILRAVDLNVDAKPHHTDIPTLPFNPPVASVNQDGLVARTDPLSTPGRGTRGESLANMNDFPSVGRICIVANELAHLFRNGGIGTHNWLLAQALNSEGWKVHILYTAEVEDAEQLRRCRRMCNATGISLWHLPEFASPEEDSVHCGLIGEIDRHSLHVRRALEQLDVVHRFDLIEFAEWSGYAFRSVQARRMGSGLSNARIIVKLHSSSQWCRDGNRAWLADSDELIRDYYERYSFEHADYQISPSQYMLDYAAGIGWRVRDDAQVIPNCFPTSATSAAAPEGGTPELVFFGRLERRKGLKLFLAAVQTLPAGVPITFLGRELPVDGLPATQLIAEQLAGRPVNIYTNFDREAAHAYLCGPNRLAIMPSLVENYPFTVLECAASAIPFLASRVGGIPEIVHDRKLQDALLFEPTVSALRQQLDRYLATDGATRRRYAEQMHSMCNAGQNHAAVRRAYAEMLPIPNVLQMSATPSSTVAAGSHPLVTVVVPYYNMGEFLPETLASIAAQDYPNIECIVVNDGSTDPHSLEVWQQMRACYPHFQFITQDNRGLGGARNAGLKIARGEFFIPVDADNVARPNMVSRFVQALQRNPELSVATCYFLAFDETEHLERRKYMYAYRPCGGPLVAAALRNVYGDANAMTRTAALRSVGGYETDKDTTCEDWELYVKLAVHGHQIDVIPEYLFYYRHRQTSLFRTTDFVLNRRRVLRQFFAATELPRAEQIELWTALASFDEGQRNRPHLQQPAPVAAEKKRTGVRLAVHRFKGVMRKAPYYSTISGTLKKFKRKRAA